MRASTEVLSHIRMYVWCKIVFKKQIMVKFLHSCYLYTLFNKITWDFLINRGKRQHVLCDLLSLRSLISCVAEVYNMWSRRNALCTNGIWDRCEPDADTLYVQDNTKAAQYAMSKVFSHSGVVKTFKTLISLAFYGRKCIFSE